MTYMDLCTCPTSRSLLTNRMNRNRVFFCRQRICDPSQRSFQTTWSGAKPTCKGPAKGCSVANVGKKWKKPIDVKKQKDTWQLSVIRQLGLIFLTLEGIFPLFLPRLTLQHAISAGSAWHVHTGTLCIGANPPCRPNLLVFWRSSETLNPHPCVTWCWPSQEWHSKTIPSCCPLDLLGDALLQERTPTDVAGNCLLIRSHKRPFKPFSSCLWMAGDRSCSKLCGAD